MRKLFLVVLVVVIALALMIPLAASGHPMGDGKGCGCHRSADKMTGSIHTGYQMSGGANGDAAACSRCH